LSTGTARLGTADAIERMMASNIGLGLDMTLSCERRFWQTPTRHGIDHRS
jgi:hypothetical protein